MASEKCRNRVWMEALTATCQTRYCFLIVICGLVFVDSPGLYDPCEREPTNLCDLIDLQERECITTSAQVIFHVVIYSTRTLERFWLSKALLIIYFQVC